MPVDGLGTVVATSDANAMLSNRHQDMEERRQKGRQLRILHQCKLLLAGGFTLAKTVQPAHQSVQPMQGLFVTVPASVPSACPLTC